MSSCHHVIISTSASDIVGYIPKTIRCQIHWLIWGGERGEEIMQISVLKHLYMCLVGIWLCHIPTLYHYVRFPPGGNMTGGNMLGNLHHHHLHHHHHHHHNGFLRQLQFLWCFLNTAIINMPIQFLSAIFNQFWLTFE